MFNWKVISEDPNDRQMFDRWLAYYENNIVNFDIFSKNNRDERILELCGIKSIAPLKILDVGFAEHGIEYAKKPDWFHAKLRKNPLHDVTGIDINKQAIEEIREYTQYDNLFYADATNVDLKIGLGDFDIIHAGDVIEHLSNPGDFLYFCKNNLKSHGKIVITTPNPICKYSLPAYRKYGFLANMEHTCWISPTNMNELCRRTGLVFAESHYKMNKNKSIKNILRENHIRKYKDLYFSEFQYILINP